MGKHDQEHVAEPARPPLTTEQAREVTAGLREAMDDVRRSVTVLAARVRDAHAAHVWLLSGTAAGSRTARRSSTSPARRPTGSWTSPAPWQRSTTRSPPAAALVRSLYDDYRYPTAGIDEGTHDEVAHAQLHRQVRKR